MGQEDLDIKNVKVKNMLSSKNNAVLNQFVITTEDGRYFQSYDSIIAFIANDGSVFLDNYYWNFSSTRSKYWNYSATTSKYRNQFLGVDTKTIKDNIKSGIYKLINLN